MNFVSAKARQPEVIRTVQKDFTYTNELAEDLSDILRLVGTRRKWIEYNHLCKLLAELCYHSFAALNNLQTIGSEYTGIIQIDSYYQSIPSKYVQLFAILLEFGGEAIFLKLLNVLQNSISKNTDILPNSKKQMLLFIKLLRQSTYLKALHKTIFYFNSNKYQLSKRILNINYILIRQWMQPSHSLYGYKVLGYISLLQLLLSVFINASEILQVEHPSPFQNELITRNRPEKSFHKCILCLDERCNTSLTSCGHLFCWNCILDWLHERNECPICRETLKKSNIIQMKNYL